MVHPRGALRREHGAHDVERVRAHGGGRARDGAAEEGPRRRGRVASRLARSPAELAQRRELDRGVGHPQEERGNGAGPQPASALLLQDGRRALHDAPVLAPRDAVQHGLHLHLHADLDDVERGDGDARDSPGERAGHRVREGADGGSLTLSIGSGAAAGAAGPHLGVRGPALDPEPRREPCGGAQHRQPSGSADPARLPGGCARETRVRRPSRRCPEGTPRHASGR